MIGLTKLRYLLRLNQTLEIVYMIELNGIEYENFIYVMEENRQLIKAHANLCADGVVWEVNAQT